MVIHEPSFVSRSIYLSINDATEVLINENLFLNTISRLILGAIYVSKGTEALETSAWGTVVFLYQYEGIPLV